MFWKWSKWWKREEEQWETRSENEGAGLSGLGGRSVLASSLKETGDAVGCQRRHP